MAFTPRAPDICWAESTAIESALVGRCRLFSSRSSDHRCLEIGRIEIIFAGNPDQGEQGIASGIGQRRSHSMRRRRLADGADRPIRDIHSPEACARIVVRLTMPAAWSIAVVCTVAISCWLKVLRTMSSPLDSGA